MKNIIVIGAGGHASVIIDILENMKKTGHKINVKGLLDDKENLTEFMGYPVLDKIKNILVYNDENTEFVIAIGSNKIRKEIATELSVLKYFIPIHPTAIIGTNVLIKEGTVVMPRVVINTNTTIGKHVIINSGAVIEHDNIIGDYVHVSPGTILAGGVSIGELTQIGANSTVIQCVEIGSNTIVGAGSTVIRNIESDVTAVGSPAKVLKALEV
ncbi:acetyltransferase [Terrisporobacter sp.]|uniref:acetyltransferase n=3 Tax=Terrisporobacter TaxID=1505652 RepID=UPI0028A09048|nr:acetyltransferase [Terrisporobacter sp.]